MLLVYTLPLVVRGGAAYEQVLKETNKKQQKKNSTYFSVFQLPPNDACCACSPVFIFSIFLSTIDSVPAVSLTVWCLKLNRQRMLRIHFPAKFGFFGDRIWIWPWFDHWDTSFYMVIVLVSFFSMINLSTRQNVFHKPSLLKALPSMLNNMVFLGI